MLLETVVTNGAAILTMIVLWSVVTWAVTYMYMSRKVSDLNYTIEVLDWYIYEADQERSLMVEERAGKDEYIAHLKSIIEGDEVVEYVITEKGNWILKGVNRD
jgi:hypothetical protein